MLNTMSVLQLQACYSYFNISTGAAAALYVLDKKIYLKASLIDS